MELHLSDQAKHYVRLALASGAYQNVDELIEQALFTHLSSDKSLAYLSEEVQKGIDSGIDPRPFNFEEFRERMRVKHGAGK